MNSRRVAGFAALALLPLTACDSAGGSANPSDTSVVRVSAPNFITLAPIPESTTSTTAVGEVPAGTVPGEQIYKVQALDYLLKIADHFCIDAQAIIDYNTWTDGFDHQLQPNVDIKIPPGACSPGGNTGESVPADTPTDDPTGSETSTTRDPAAPPIYIVEDGDTLSGIAAKTGTTVEAILEANGWDDPNHLIYAGLEINMPSSSG